MKPIILSLLFISFIFLPACRGNQEQTPVPGGAGDGKVKYSKDIKPLDYKPDQFKTYTLTPPAALTPASLKEQSQRIFDITGVKNVPFIPDTARSPFSQYLSLRRADDPSGVFEMHRQTGRIVFNRGLKAYKTDLATPGLPSDDDAIKRTQALIEQLQLGVDARELTKPDVTFLEMSAVKDNEPSQTFRKMVTVRYDRMLDGLRVEGGTRLIFSFGRDAELTSMIWDWGKWEPRQVAAEAVGQPHLRGATAFRLEQPWAADQDRCRPRPRYRDIQPIEAVEEVHSARRILRRRGCQRRQPHARELGARRR